MKTSMPATLIATLTTTLASTIVVGGAFAGDKKKLTEKEVPKPVVTAVAAKYPDAKNIAYGQENEHGKSIYEVEFKQATTDVSLDVSPEGKILVEETVVAASALPAAVKQGIDGSKYKSWKVDKAEKVIEGDKADAPVYEVVVKSKGKKVEVVFDKDGKITKEQAKTAKDTD